MTSPDIVVLESEAAKKLNSGRHEEALQLLNELANNNSSYAFFSLGWMHETGAAGSIDIEMAEYFYRCAAYLGREDANFELGRLLAAQGNEATARDAFHAGAELGDVSCMARVGKMMVDGRGGAVDLKNGNTWLHRAADEGHFFAQRTLFRLAENKANSIIEKLAIKAKIASLAKRAAREALDNPRSKLLR